MCTSLFLTPFEETQIKETLFTVTRTCLYRVHINKKNVTRHLKLLTKHKWNLTKDGEFFVGLINSFLNAWVLTGLQRNGKRLRGRMAQGGDSRDDTTANIEQRERRYTREHRHEKLRVLHWGIYRAVIYSRERERQDCERIEHAKNLGMESQWRSVWYKRPG